MVIGKGLIASLFMTSDDELNSKVVFFASGVSNSLEERKESEDRLQLKINQRSARLNS